MADLAGRILDKVGMLNPDGTFRTDPHSVEQARILAVSLIVAEHLRGNPDAASDIGYSSRNVAMRIREFEHVVCAAGAIVGANDIIVVGSQALLGQLPRKYVANREKDRDFIAAAIRIDLCDQAVLQERAGDLPLEPDRIEGIRVRLRRDFRQHAKAD